MTIGTWLTGILKPVADIVDEFHFSGEEKAAAKNALFSAQIDLAQRMLDYEMKIAEQQARVIEAEAKGDSWLQRNWRPLTMMVFTTVIAWNFIVAPTGTWLSGIYGWPVPPPLPVPDGMWALLQIGIGGYIGGRTIEKVADTLKSGGFTFKGQKEG